MVICGIDPGPDESAYVLWDTESQRILGKENVPNTQMLQMLSSTVPLSFANLWPDGVQPQYLAIERVRGFGIMASDALFDTCENVGRFEHAFGAKRTSLIPRKGIATHICQNSGATHDKFIREALITRFGGEARAIGSKKTGYGPLHGITGHLWAALATALTCADLRLWEKSIE